MPSVDDIADGIVEQVNGDADVLRQIIDRLDDRLASLPLERTIRLWDVSAAQVATMFDVSRQAVSKWLDDGPPAQRRDQVALLDQCTELLDRWVKRERIPAVVRRPVDVLGGRSRLDVALAGEFEVLRDELADTFDLTRVAP